MTDAEMVSNEQLARIELAGHRVLGNGHAHRVRPVREGAKQRICHK